MMTISPEASEFLLTVGAGIKVIQTNEHMS